MDQCSCRYKIVDTSHNLPKFLMTTTPMTIEVSGNNFLTIL